MSSKCHDNLDNRHHYQNLGQRLAHCEPGASCSWWWSEGGPWSHQSPSSSSRSHSLDFPYLCAAFDSPSLPILSNKRYHPRSKIRSSSIPILPSQKWAFQGKILSLPTISLFNSRWKTIQAIQKYVHLFGWTQLFWKSSVLKFLLMNGWKIFIHCIKLFPITLIPLPKLKSWCETTVHWYVW